jgi:hypothetical protein
LFDNIYFVYVRVFFVVVCSVFFVGCWGWKYYCMGFLMGELICVDGVVVTVYFLFVLRCVLWLCGIVGLYIVDVGEWFWVNG